MLPVRCFTCNNTVGHMWQTYMTRRQTCSPYTVLNELGLTRVCCRRMILGHVCVIDDMLSYSNTNHVLDDAQTELMCDNDRERTLVCE